MTVQQDFEAALRERLPDITVQPLPDGVSTITWPKTRYEVPAFLRAHQTVGVVILSGWDEATEATEPDYSRAVQDLVETIVAVAPDSRIVMIGQVRTESIIDPRIDPDTNYFCASVPVAIVPRSR